jgi:hypothetical protein
MEQHFLSILIDYRLRHRKGVAIHIATYASLQQKKLGFIEQKMYF